MVAVQQRLAQPSRLRHLQERRHQGLPIRSLNNRSLQDLFSKVHCQCDRSRNTAKGDNRSSPWVIKAA
jgi:hypothetical protein